MVDGKKRWVAIEKGPDKYRRQRRFNAEAAEVMKVVPMDCEIDNTATIWRSKKDIARFDCISSQWHESEHWNKRAADTQLTWDEFRTRMAAVQP